jgi:hypothetical protein
MKWPELAWRVIPWQTEWGIVRGDAALPYRTWPDRRDAELAVAILNTWLETR